jgi:hypothetical protein
MTRLLGNEQEDRRVRPSTRSNRLIRLAAITLYLAAIAMWVELVGTPKQTALVVVWIWLAVIAWDVRRPWLEHLAFLRDWWLPLGILTVYLYSRGLSDDLGFVAVHVTEPISIDTWLFGGTLPTEWLQAQLCGVPCERSQPPRWYDVALTTVYYSHFVVTLSVGGVLWVRSRPQWIHYMRRYVSLSALALVGYILYPMAPPWMAARDGYLSPAVHRITGRGWYDLGHSDGAGKAHQEISAVGNQVAAMPSLHAALALFVAVYAMIHLSTPWRWTLPVYPLAMSFMLVYYAEHYVVDVLAGYACVAVVMFGWAWADASISGSHRRIAHSGALHAQRRFHKGAWRRRPAGRPHWNKPLESMHARDDGS